MAQGKSGRVVIDIEPQLKKNLYVALAQRQLTMKDWFLTAARKLLAERPRKAVRTRRRRT